MSNSLKHWSVYSIVLKHYRLNGSYSALKGGSASEAMEDFTGGVSELVELHKEQKNIFDLIKKSISKMCMLSCAIEVSKHNDTLSMLVF